jgi:hypothetical protein
MKERCYSMASTCDAIHFTLWTSKARMAAVCHTQFLFFSIFLFVFLPVISGGVRCPRRRSGTASATAYLLPGRGGTDYRTNRTFRSGLW